MKIDGELTPEGRFTGALTCPPEEQAAWLKRFQAASPAEAPIQKMKRLVLHNTEVETDLDTGIPLLGTVSADVRIVADQG